ncbi:MAG TPA: hypothetical protein VML54_17390, partial [Candidatus Limnocylindrales bacterium]|nr:hypothetical protein [Candidatus Limnocylindrales bacterium]
MSATTNALDEGRRGAAGRPLVVSRARTGRRILADRWASRLVITGGLVIIASVLGILLVIAAEVYPLFESPTATLVGHVPAPGLAAGWALAAGDAAGVDEYREVAFAVSENGVLAFTSLKAGPAIPAVPVPGLEGGRVSIVTALGKGQYLLGTGDGRVIPLTVGFEAVFTDGRRTVIPRPEFGQAAALDPEAKRPILRVAAASPAAGAVRVAQVGPTELVIQSVIEKKALIGGSTKEESRGTLAVSAEGEITAVRLDGRGEDMFVGTSRGQILHYDLREPASPRMKAATATGIAPVPITALGFLLGDRTLIAGDEAGGVSTWQVVPPPEGGEARLTRMHGFAGHKRPIVSVNASQRDKGFVTADAGGSIRVHYGTSGHTLLALEAEAGGLLTAVLAPKADGVLALDRRGVWSHWQLDNPHPEITLRTVFGKVWYEGYSKPEYVWQSTGGTDDFEAKFSLTPLLYGTLKGTFYALLIAVPLALLGALYVSEFMHPAVKAYVKPVVEIMAALPSVVLGFLAGLWLAP